MSFRVCHFLTAYYKNHLHRIKRGPIISSLFVTVLVFLALLTSPALSYYCVCECDFGSEYIAVSSGSEWDCINIGDWPWFALACSELSTSEECDTYCAGASFAADCGHGCDPTTEQCREERGRYYAEDVEGIVFQAGNWECLGDACKGTVVTLSDFSAYRNLADIRITWQTASEIDTAGFNLLRSTMKDGTYTKITKSLIAAEGSATSGATYTYTDTDVTGPQIYYYKLEEVSTSGSRSYHGPVSAAMGNVAVGEVGGTGSIPASKTADGIGDIHITGTGSHTVTTGKYSSNPAGTSSFTPTGDYWFVNLDKTTGLTQLTFAFTPAQSRDTVYYWNGSGWVACSSQSLSNDTITVTITSCTHPRLGDLKNLIFALGRGSAAIPTLSERGMILFCLLLGTTVVALMWRRRGVMKGGHPIMPPSRKNI